ncbi:MAG: response regulator [Symploca sp. SIO3C6]|uniref:Response regulator n=1 Tax=Symploca sp. SIO1C4 TaxID=2607765 RepID=A0A6B3NBJ7_9CYAN|nr:response regulator [Symploca sp. SIO3C6]NER30926.1 response regulator [Symploca sp. SIO1C4]NET04263.1 response regulator [Symploca sp. SIO2B6]
MSKVLVVEDTLSELELISTYLRQSGYTVIVATDGKEALNKAVEYQPDAIVTDLVMPGMSGLELCRRLRDNPETKKLPIVACTSKNKELDRLWAMKQGVKVYVTKPFTKDELISAVKYGLNQ